MRRYEQEYDDMKTRADGDWVCYEAAERIIKELIEAARPFIDCGIVDELTGTIPLMDRLEKAIESAEKSIT